MHANAAKCHDAEKVTTARDGKIYPRLECQLCSRRPSAVAAAIFARSTTQVVTLREGREFGKDSGNQSKAPWVQTLRGRGFSSSYGECL